MHRPIRGMVLLLLAAVLAGQGQGELTVIPASEDVYLNMGEERVSVFNQSDSLLCAINVTENYMIENLTREISYPGAPAVQFNISGQNLSGDDMAVLLLKAESIRQGSDPIMVALLTIGSEWNESSDYTTFLVNILPAWNIVKNNDATAYSSNTDGDDVFAFDVSKKLQDAGAQGDRISFLLEAFSNSSAEISFFSRESGSGPCLVVMPYPRTDGNASVDMADTEELPENIGSTSNLSSTLQSSNVTGNLQLSNMDSILQLNNKSGEFNLSDLIDVGQTGSMNLTA